ncbi:hypothetical protein AB3N02_21980 [Priestia aryabhattai]|uniref:hypothetical protein n=1 Tax=Priestia aryabhattai TaxID=412384 RepID=UPI0039A11707
MNKAEQIYNQLSQEHKGLCAPPEWLIQRILEISSEIDRKDDEGLIVKAQKTVALITSYSKGTTWAREYRLMYEVFQDSAIQLNKALGTDRFDWEVEMQKDILTMVHPESGEEKNCLKGSFAYHSYLEQGFEELPQVDK